MPGIARNGDTLTTGHNCTPITTLIGQTGLAQKVYVNGKPVVCDGDPTVVHSDGTDFPICSSQHTANVNAGSTTVFVGGKGIARIGDSADNGLITGGSVDSFAGG